MLKPASLFIFILFNLICNGQVVELKDGWQFKKEKDSSWHKATVPGTVHTDLLLDKLIPDPLYADNENKLQWVGKTDWDYRLYFNVSKKFLENKNPELLFEGLDTYADVYLNDQLILRSDNMFRGWTVDVKKLLKHSHNKLFIRFFSAENIVDSIAKSRLPLVLPDNPRVYSRKAQYNFGWDFAPKLITCGIWKKVFLRVRKSLPSPSHAVMAIDNDVSLVQEPDSIGRSFYFQKNHKPMYVKGANWVPADVFLPRVTKAKYRRLLIAAKNAGINMLRVWGGGIYEDDAFYSLCDSLNIMVWQDFMFAGGMIPGDDHFFNNVREEVKYQLLRLHNHRCIVLWCGNNEVDEAWHNWDWQQQFNVHNNDSAAMWNTYLRLFHDSLPLWVSKYDGRAYISTTPMNGWGRTESLKEGDSHYWGVWWGLEKIEVFENKTGRFVSEYGMQAMPGYNSIENFTNDSDRYLFSSVLKAHQKHPTGFENLQFYLDTYFMDSDRVKNLPLRAYTYLTQCLQYYSLKNIIAIHISKYPYNMGTMLWQLNDCWPGASWSILNYDGSPKAGWYAVKLAYTTKVARDTVYPKSVKLLNPRISIKVSANKIIVTSKGYAKYVYISVDGKDEFLSDNYFDLGPGRSRLITMNEKIDAKRIKVMSLYDVIFTELKPCLVLPPER